MKAQFLFCGQAGIHLRCADGIEVLVDPYFSDAVEKRYGSQLARQVRSPYGPGEPRGISAILVTHAHEDHADPESLEQVLAANPEAVVIGPSSVRAVLSASRVLRRFRDLGSSEVSLGGNSVREVPAAHTELRVGPDGRPEFCGYLIRSQDSLFYHAGDTVPHPDILSAVRAVGAPDVAFLPCNERNYYRDRAGIVGNMTVREMLQFAQELGTKVVVPIHWDMFAPNSVFPEEIRLVHEKSRCSIPLMIPEPGRWYSVDELMKLAL